MSKKHLMNSGFVSFLLFLLTLSLFSGSQFVGLVSANFFPAPVPEHTIEITANGDVIGTDKIQRNGNIYTFTGDIVGSIVIFRDGIVVDGAGYTLQGNGYRTGVWFQEITGVTDKGPAHQKLHPWHRIYLWNVNGWLQRYYTFWKYYNRQRIWNNCLVVLK